ncbi:stage III sporulation protein AF [Lutibacter sp. B2]|nr:stage III sporulation protein AF [Lutibacter sp. B2]
MFDFLKDWIKNIVILIIFITMLELLLPNSSMKKYVNMVVGLLLIIVILNPLVLIVNKNIDIENEVFKTSVEIDKNAVVLTHSNLEKTQENQMIQVYKRKIEQHIKERVLHNNPVDVKNVYMEIDEDQTSDNFGNIQNLKIELSPNVEKKSDNENLQPVSQILVDIKSNKENDTEHEQIDEQIVNQIREDMAEFYSINSKNVVINVKQ